MSLLKKSGKQKKIGLFLNEEGIVRQEKTGSVGTTCYRIKLPTVKFSTF